MPDPTARDGEIIRLRNRTRALEANGAELLARAERAEAALEHVRGIHRKSLFAAANGTHRGKHYCMSCTFSADDWTYYEPYPCPTATAVNAPHSPAGAPTAVTAATEAHGGAGEAREGSDG